jgi:antirestriction protein ArdC
MSGLGTSVYEVITQRILEKLEAGTVPWHKPWATAGGSPRNLVSGHQYRGINVFLLGCQGFSSPYWLTFNQAKTLGGNVRKAQRGTPVVFWKWIERSSEDPETGQTVTQKIPLVRYYSVFSVEQCAGIRHTRLEAEQEEPEPFDPIETAEEILAGYPEPPSISEDGRGAAYYRPATDSIHMPKRETFESEPHYYATLFHEMAHSSGHQKRLARPGITDPIRYASHSYSQEELVAEMGAAFLLAEAGIDTDGLMDNSAAYVASWLRELRTDSKLVIFAGAQAQRAADRILGRAFEGELEARAA